MGKHKYFKVTGFLNFSYEAEIHAVTKTWRKMYFHSTGKAWENTNISNLWVS